jgi:hypothetical protein
VAKKKQPAGIDAGLHTAASIGWATPQDLMRMTGLTKSQFDAAREEFGRGQSRGQGAMVEVHGHTIFQGLWEAWQDKLLGGKAKHEERLKKAQADKAELELAKARNEVIEITAMRHAFSCYGDSMRRALETVGKLSPEAQRIVMDSLRESEQRFAEQYGYGQDADEPGDD